MPELPQQVLDSLTADLEARVWLRYRVELSNGDPFVLRFHLRWPAGELRATADVLRAANTTTEQLLIDTVREIHSVLSLCPFCVAEMEAIRFGEQFDVRCPTCGHYVVDLALARELARARAVNDAAMLVRAAAVSTALRNAAQVTTLNGASFTRLAAGG